MVGVSVAIHRYVDDSYPGWVECRLTDSHGHEWLFVEKVPIVSVEDLDAASDYPQPGVVACEVVRRTGAGADEVVEIDTERPWVIVATTGETRFEVRSEQIVNLD